MEYDFRAVFTLAARQAVPRVQAQGMLFTFDCEAPQMGIIGKPQALRGALHRLIMALCDMTESGMISLNAKAETLHSGTSFAAAECWSIGKTQSLDVIRAVLHRLGLIGAFQDWRDNKGLQACGVCPHTGGPITFEAALGEGLRFKFHLPCVDIKTVYNEVDARHANVWLVALEPGRNQAWTRRLTRLGWQISSMDTYTQAAQAAHTAEARPALVLCMEREDPGLGDPSLIPAALGPQVRLVYTVQVGSPTLRSPEAMHGFEVRVYPLGADYLEALSLQAGLLRQPGHAPGILHAYMDEPSSPYVLLETDDQADLADAKAALLASGCSVTSTTSNDDVLGSCRDKPPDFVLLDLDTNGIELTREMRLLQHDGWLPLFAIAAFTRSGTPARIEAAMQAGVDQCMDWPVTAPALSSEVRRFCTLQ